MPHTFKISEGYIRSRQVDLISPSPAELAVLGAGPFIDAYNRLLDNRALSNNQPLYESRPR